MDFFILLPAVLLSCLGLLMIFSISFEDDTSFFIRQSSYLIFSLVLYLIIINIKFKTMLQISYLFYFFLIGFLFLTFLIGIEVRGSTRWVDLGFVTIQGSELAKPVITLALAYLLAYKAPVGLKIFLISAAVVAVPALFILTQPDLSNAVILAATWFLMVFIAGAGLHYLIALIVLGLVSLPIIWNLVLKDYQRLRVITFFNPNLDPQGASYNLVQALIALGSGQFFGRGLGRGTQSHLDFLPEGRTDFIFAATGEELGFVGVGLIIVIFSLLIFRILYLATKSTQIETKLFAYGVASVLSIQFFMNAAMNMGIFPISGVTLPFVSFGGSSLASLFILLSLVNSATKSSIDV
ncbi:MAG: FtsW/RodA/SpoVE family cell cycle protein [Candidatus Woykebacteria bacterium]